MTQGIAESVLEILKAQSIRSKELIQELWSGYGKLYRYELKGGKLDSVIVKEINLNAKSKHPRGWNTNTAHQRKRRSYQIETEWYRNWASRCKAECRLPKLLYQYADDKKIFLLMEDLDASGFPKRLEAIDLNGIKLVLKWLAHFHATFMGEAAEGLWQEGAYWHLNTRWDEWESMEDGALKQNARSIAETLSSSKYQTIIHGDAKLANFCFSDDLQKVAAVDFQYVGGGCGIKDVAYFLSSCMSSDDLTQFDQQLLDHYFERLEVALLQNQSELDIKVLKAEWVDLYAYAWADFARFLKGWSPDHWKLHEYSEKMIKKVL